MNQRFLAFSATVLLFTAAAFAQNPITADSPFQVRYAANLDKGDAFVNITNTGATGGNICVNVYAFSPDEQLISCCTCPVTPDGLVSLSVRSSLTSNTLTGVVPPSVVIKLVSTAGGACNAATASATALASGLAAWGTSLHALPLTPGSPAGTYGVTETAFTPATLSTAELTRITGLCGFIQTDGSGFGICKGCALGGLGAAAAQ
jgi:hypothetical protein